MYGFTAAQVGKVDNKTKEVKFKDVCTDNVFVLEVSEDKKSMTIQMSLFNGLLYN